MPHIDKIAPEAVRLATPVYPMWERLFSRENLRSRLESRSRDNFSITT